MYLLSVTILRIGIILIIFQTLQVFSLGFANFLLKTILLQFLFKRHASLLCHDNTSPFGERVFPKLSSKFYFFVFLSIYPELYKKVCFFLREHSFFENAPLKSSSKFWQLKFPFFGPFISISQVELSKNTTKTLGICSQRGNFIHFTYYPTAVQCFLRTAYYAIEFFSH